jgi:hypothetical protein
VYLRRAKLDDCSPLDTGHRYCRATGQANDSFVPSNVNPAPGNDRRQSLQNRNWKIESRFKADCSQSGFAAQQQPPLEPAIRHPARWPTAAPSAAVTQQRWAA